MQGSRVRIPRGPATVMRVVERAKSGRCVCPHESTMYGGVRANSVAAGFCRSACLCCKAPFRNGKGALHI